jgi:hypothetical protein
VRSCCRRRKQTVSLSDGTVDLKAFSEKALGIADIKLEAPEIVQPTGTRSIAESIRSLDETQEAFNSLRPLFEKYDASEPKFPHPYLGDMTAVEWLAMYGGHEVRQPETDKASIGADRIIPKTSRIDTGVPIVFPSALCYPYNLLSIRILKT